MKNLFQKNQSVLICSCIFLTFLICMSSCKKENNQKSTPILTENQTTDQAVVEKVDSQLLQKYVDYELKLEAKNLRSQSNPSSQIDVTDLEMNKFAFEKMVNNYLANERNIMRQAPPLKNNLRLSPNTLYTPDPQHCYDENGVEISCPIVGGGSTVSCLGTFTGMNTTNTVLFVGGLNNASDSLTSNGFGFGGFSGIWTPVGSINQTYSQDVISYQQYYSEALHDSHGVTYTQLYLLYGNIYQGTCTVHGMRAVIQ